MLLEVTKDEFALLCKGMTIWSGMAADGYIYPSGDEEVAMISLVHKMAIAAGKDDIALEAIDLAEEFNVPFSPA
jgi:hypothetical protein